MPFQKGYKMSEEHKHKLSLAHKGKKFSEEHKNKIGLASAIFRIGKKHSPETRKKISEAQKGKPRPYQGGKNHYNWKGGITPENMRIRQSFEYKLWRIAVFERDNYTCIWCSARSGKGKKVILNADHIKEFCNYPELRFAIDNGRTLCLDCHKKTDSWRKFYGNQYV